MRPTTVSTPFELQKILRARGWHDVADELLLAALEPGIVGAGSRSANFTVDVDAPILAARQPTIGDGLAGIVDPGTEPVKIGAVYRSTKPTYTDGLRAELQVGSRGALAVQLMGADSATPMAGQSNSADGLGAGTGLVAISESFLFNGTNFDRQRVVAKLIDIPVTAVVAAAPVTLWTPGAGKKFRLMGWALSLSVAGSVILLDNAAGAFVPGGRTPLMAAGVGLVSPPMGNGFLSAAANNVLKADVSASGNIQGFVFGTEE